MRDQEELSQICLDKYSNYNSLIGAEESVWVILGYLSKYWTVFPNLYFIRFPREQHEE